MTPDRKTRLLIRDKSLHLCLLVLILIGVKVSGQSNEQLAAAAEKAYASGKYDTTAQLYERILKSGYESTVLYYNLGNAYFRQNDIPSAILNYEKALKLDPTHSDIRYNLTIANARITDKVEPIPELFYKRWWKSFMNIFSLDLLAAIVIALLVLSLISTAIYLTSRSLPVRKAAFWTALSLFFLFGLTFYAAQQKEHFIRNHHEAIVFTPTVTVKSSPDNASKDLFVIHEGIKVELLDEIGEWQEIRIANGSVGWLKASDIKMI